MSEPDISAMSFEQAMKELEGVVGRLERGEVPLDESIRLYERGTLLKEAEERVEKITLGTDGAPNGTVPVEGL